MTRSWSRAGSETRTAVALLVAIVAVGVLEKPIYGGGQQPPATNRTANQPKRASPVEVTPVAGPSTLRHLGLSIERSSMGWDGQWGAPPSNIPVPSNPPIRGEGSAARMLVSGEDLYRISCRACHKPNGSGAPPEINSIIGPVQSASAAWMTQRMKAAGRPVDPAFIRQLTSSTEADLQKRLKTGGHNMPSFDHLSDDEIAVLRPYLDQLADVPGAATRKRQIEEPAERIGELIIKGTCHICHDATGPDQQTTVLSGVIPSLASMPHQKTVAQFVEKVREGTPVPLNAGGVLSRGRMPVFNYLSPAEARAAYSYLVSYPPR